MHVVKDEFRTHIEDNGKGTLDRNRGKDNFGLLIMQERVRQLHGRIAFDSAPGDGFRIDISLPVDAVKANPDSN
jgi:signal transduction histidine kinase